MGDVWIARTTCPGGEGRDGGRSGGTAPSACSGFDSPPIWGLEKHDEDPARPSACGASATGLSWCCRCFLGIEQLARHPGLVGDLNVDPVIQHERLCAQRADRPALIHNRAACCWGRHHRRAGGARQIFLHATPSAVPSQPGFYDGAPRGERATRRAINRRSPVVRSGQPRDASSTQPQFERQE